jgi:hypothetical protein
MNSMNEERLIGPMAALSNDTDQGLGRRRK